MSNVSANIGANTQQAESSIGRLLASLRKLRQESATGVGMKMFASDEVNKLSSALNQAIAAAGALNKLDLSQFDSSLRRSAELLKRNAVILDDWMAQQNALSYVKPRAGTTAFLKLENSRIQTETFCVELLQKTGAFLTPGSRFPGWEGWLRIGYAPQTEVLKMGLSKLETML